jgi:hypothetical protein
VEPFQNKRKIAVRIFNSVIDIFNLRRKLYFSHQFLEVRSDHRILLCDESFYTFKLKQVAIVDICIIAIGFVLRVLAGGYVTGIIVTNWAVLLTFVLALVLAIGKRRGELINAQISGKPEKLWTGITFSLLILHCLSVAH